VPIVTLITDLGIDTHVIAKAKVQILSAIPLVNIFDISHAVTPFLIEDAVFLAKSCVNDFPKSTIHIIAVDVDIKKHKRVIACRYKDQIFITADNGFLTMLTDNLECEYFEVPFHASINGSFSPLKNILIPIAIAIAKKGLDNIGESISTITERTLEPLVIFKDSLRGKVIYVNNYGNAVTNITQAIFDDKRVNQQFNVVLNRFDSISKLSNSYSDVSTGNSLCFFNEEGLLEIAINNGEASTLLGLRKDKRVTIEFFTERTISKIKGKGLI